MEQRTYFENAAAIAAECSSPVRLAILEFLLENGPTRVRVLSESMGIPESTLSNHLRRLRESQILEVKREGKTATYSIANPSIRLVISNLFQAAGSAAAAPIAEQKPVISFARSCYDHLAGALGVQLTKALFEKEALSLVDSEVVLGNNAERNFAYLGVGLSSLDNNRKFAFLCNDWTHRESHIAGALGAALLRGLLSKGWLEPVPNSRGLLLTSEGKTGLEQFIGHELDTPL
nr:metalloregulator ArsR/SmtB family transcription factor [Corynebacterium lactis]